MDVGAQLTAGIGYIELSDEQFIPLDSLGGVMLCAFVWCLDVNLIKYFLGFSFNASCCKRSACSVSSVSDIPVS